MDEGLTPDAVLTEAECALRRLSRLTGRSVKADVWAAFSTLRGEIGLHKYKRAYPGPEKLLTSAATVVIY